MEGYPHLAFQKRWHVSSSATYLLGRCHAIIESIGETPLDPDVYQEFLQVSLKKGAQATTAIEGNTLTDAEIDRIQQGERLPPSKTYQETEVVNILEAMNTILEEVTTEGYVQLVSPQFLLRLHEMIGKDLGETFEAVPGTFAQKSRVVGRYRAPLPEFVQPLVEELCEWLKREFGYAQGNQSFADAVVQAIVSHVYLEWIHPFDDGNGRTGRLLELYILLRAGIPDIASHILSNHYNDTRPQYYQMLERAKADDLTEFIDYATVGLHDGLVKVRDAIQHEQFKVAWRSYIYDTFADVPYRKKEPFKRQRNLMLQVPLTGEYRLDELLSNIDLLREYAKLTEQTLMRDAAFLVKLGLLKKQRGKYSANTGVLLGKRAQRLNLKGKEK